MKSWEAVDCPTCPAKKGQRCRTMTTSRSTDTHVLRIDRWEELRRRQLDQQWQDAGW